MKYALDVFPFYAPYINSYKRLYDYSWAFNNINSWFFLYIILINNIKKNKFSGQILI